MIKQDYFLRMIQEIITLLVNALLNRQKIRKESWVEYDDITRQILGVPSENLKVEWCIVHCKCVLLCCITLSWSNLKNILQSDRVKNSF